MKVVDLNTYREKKQDRRKKADKAVMSLLQDVLGQLNKPNNK